MTDPFDSPVEVKVCGITRLRDAQAALEYGADYLGFIFYADSPRAVSVERAAGIARELPSGTRAVGVFVNERAEEVRRVAAECGLYAVQIHGDERAEEFAGTHARLWRALRVGGGVAEPDPDDWPAARYVVDAHVIGVYGGTGVPADWDAAARLAAQHPVMLAGGLDPGNVVEAVRTVHPVGVDVASGIEAEPGKKNLTRMRSFIERAKSAATG